MPHPDVQLSSLPDPVLFLSAGRQRGLHKGNFLLPNDPYGLATGYSPAENAEARVSLRNSEGIILSSQFSKRINQNMTLTEFRQSRTATEPPTGLSHALAGLLGLLSDARVAFCFLCQWSSIVQHSGTSRSSSCRPYR